MKQLEQTITTVEIAEMMEINHWEVLRRLEGNDKLKGIITILGDNNFVVTDYFIKSTYTTDQNKEMPCYNVTKTGCDFLANKFTGEKGIIFTAKYVKRFREMEKTIHDNFENLSTELKAIIMHDKKLQVIASNLDKQSERMDKLEFDSPLYSCEAKEISDHVKRRGVKILGGKLSNAYNDNSIRSAVYRDIYNQIKREFGINDGTSISKTYLALKRKYLADAHECIDAYQAPFCLQEQIDNANAQMKIGV